LEILLNQPQAASARRFLNTTKSGLLQLSDFSLYSIGIRLTNVKRSQLFNSLVNDLVISGVVDIRRLEPADLPGVVRFAKKYKLYFDDAYQYALAEKYDYTIVSFDAHFDSTPRGRKRPVDLLSSGRQTS